MLLQLIVSGPYYDIQSACFSRAQQQGILAQSKQKSHLRLNLAAEVVVKEDSRSWWWDYLRSRLSLIYFGQYYWIIKAYQRHICISLYTMLSILAIINSKKMFVDSNLMVAYWLWQKTDYQSKMHKKPHTQFKWVK